MHTNDNMIREDNTASEERNKVFVSVFSIEKPGEIPMLEYFVGLGDGD